MNNQKAKMYVDSILAGLRSGAVRVLPSGDLQGPGLNLGLRTAPREIEDAILSRNGTDADVSQFRAGLSGKGQATPAHEPPPMAKPVELSPEQRAQAVIRKELELLDLRMKGVID